jgi:MFS family permease
VTAHIVLDTPPELVNEIGGWRRRFLLAGVVALVIAVIGAFFSPDQFFRSYLWSYTFFVGVTMGCLAFAMLQYLTGGAWGIVIVRLCEAAGRTLPLLALLFVPIAIGIPRLYVWSHHDAVAADEVLRHKSLYLNIPFFLVRAAVYFAGWGALAWFLNRWSREQDGSGTTLAYSRLRTISGAGLLFYGYSVTFMSIDWVMSADPHWFSTMFGMLFMVGQGLSALAFLICLLVILSRRRPFSGVHSAPSSEVSE